MAVPDICCLFTVLCLPVADGVSSPEVPSSDQPAAQLPTLIALAGVASVQE